MAKGTRLKHRIRRIPGSMISNSVMTTNRVSSLREPLEPNVSEPSRITNEEESIARQYYAAFSRGFTMAIRQIQVMENARIRSERQMRAIQFPSNNFSMNLEGRANSSSSHDHHHHQTTTTENFLNNIREAANEIIAERPDDTIDLNQLSPDARALAHVVQKYIPFALILFGKFIYDNGAKIINFILLLATFIHANNDLKREIAKQQTRSCTSLLFIMCYISACIIFINMRFGIRIFSQYTQSLTFWELLWSIIVTDFMLKLITIVLKVILTCLPARLLAFQKRGKYYLVVEATSQLYRCFVPVRSWSYYLIDLCQGPEKIFGVVLSLVYTVIKGSDALSSVKLFHTAIWKLLHNASLGTSPSTEQLIASGGVCAICHEEYSMPIKLSCKHIFCETCVSTWLDRERSCPLCRASITDDPIYRDGHTTYLIQLY